MKLVGRPLQQGLDGIRHVAAATALTEAPEVIEIIEQPVALLLASATGPALPFGLRRDTPPSARGDVTPKGLKLRIALVAFNPLDCGIDKPRHVTQLGSQLGIPEPPSRQIAAPREGGQQRNYDGSRRKITRDMPSTMPAALLAQSTLLGLELGALPVGALLVRK